MDVPIWGRTVFSINRDRLLCTDMALEFFDCVLYLAEWQGFVSDEHFSVDGTMIEALASHKSFVKKDGSRPDFEVSSSPCRFDAHHLHPVVELAQGQAEFLRGA